MLIQTDVLIIGSGVAGLSAAIGIAESRSDLNILVLSKTDREESNTSWAQGGVAAVWDFSKDNFEKHIEDTLIAGDELCDPAIVKIVVEEGHQRVRELIDWGARFDREHNGDFNLGREGGHSENRILHYKDITGWEIQRTLLEKAKSYANIHFNEDYFAINILTQHHLGQNKTRLHDDIECYGAYILNLKNKEIETILAKATIMCTGGAGQVYANTTNPKIATGDGIAMVYRAKGRLHNMEFVQFHPTSLYSVKGENPSFLISEAVRGAGAVLKTKDGNRFMHKYDSRLSLAPRDIVARAIDKEMKTRGDEFVYLDCTMIDGEEFQNHFPNIYQKCVSQGIDPLKDFIPVVPACHYICGGIAVDTESRSSIKNLWAAGECTASGLHGANRLASNSLLEGLVFGHRAAHSVIKSIDDASFMQEIPGWNAEGTTEPDEMVLLTQSWKELRDIMSYYVGIVRTNTRLTRALDRLHILYKETEELYNSSKLSPQLCELRNLITIAYLICRAAQMRRESRGLHYNLDFPDKYDYLENTIL